MLLQFYTKRFLVMWKENLENLEKKKTKKKATLNIRKNVHSISIRLIVLHA